MRAMEFIRFDTFAEEVARALGKQPDAGGLSGKITGGARNLEFLGERSLTLMNRMPRLAQWHAEAAAANVLDQPEIVDALAALKQLGELQRVLPEQLSTLATLDRRLASLPSELTLALSSQPEFKAALEQVRNTEQQVQALERSVNALEKSISSLDLQLAQLGTATRPEILRQLTDHAGGVAWARARATLLLATVCAAGLLVCWGVLRRWSNRPLPGE